VKGSPEASKTIADCALAVFAAHNLPDGMEPTLDSEATFDPSTFSFPHGTHLCAAEVDTQTGRVKLRSYVAVDDVGNVINPIIVEGQVHGGVAQGIAQALFEEAVYDDSGNLVTGSFAEYLLPSAADLPDFTTDRTETPATTHPLGVKGVGEAGTIASTPAVVNAVVDALRPWGVNDINMPLTPERVWRAASGGAGGAHSATEAAPIHADSASGADAATDADAGSGAVAATGDADATPGAATATAEAVLDADATLVADAETAAEAMPDTAAAPDADTAPAAEAATTAAELGADATREGDQA
jgi:hypothetical protein